MVSAMSSQFSIPDPQGIGEMPSFPDPRSPIFFEILCGLLLSSWPKASDEADGNTGRPQPGFFRITGKKYFVLYLRWLGEGNFLVQILCGGSVIGSIGIASSHIPITDPQGIGEMPSSPDSRSSIFF